MLREDTDERPGRHERDLERALRLAVEVNVVLADEIEGLKTQLKYSDYALAFAAFVLVIVLSFEIAHC